MQRLGERVRVRADLPLVVAERLRRGDLEARRLRGDRVLERAALHAREHRPVDRRRVLLAAEDEAGARARERLVRRRRDEVAVLDGVRVQPGGDEPGEVRHVAEQERADLVGDLAELVGLDGARIGGAAADDQLRPTLLRLLQHLVVVDGHRLARHAVRGDRVEPAAEVDLQAVRQVAAVVEAQAEDRVARLQHRHVHRHVRLRARVRLDVRVLRAEERLRAVDRQLLDLVDDLAAAVVALAGIPLGVLVRRHRADRLEDGRPREVLRGDQLDLAALAVELGRDQLGDVRIDLVEALGDELLKPLLHGGHALMLLGRSADTLPVGSPRLMGQKMFKAVAIGAFLALLSVPAALAGPNLRIGAAEDEAIWSSYPPAEMQLAKLAGFDTIRMTAQWSTGMTKLPGLQMGRIQQRAPWPRRPRDPAGAHDLQPGRVWTPATTAPAQFVQFAVDAVRQLPWITTFIVGNEPNSTTTGRRSSTGRRRAAAQYEQLLAATYDAIKAVRPSVTVVGGALDPHGNDDRRLALADDVHPRSRRGLPRERPDDAADGRLRHARLPRQLDATAGMPHTGRAIAEGDYAKLVALLGKAFDGTAQRGSTLPILYGEFGIESAIPADKAGLQRHRAAKTVDEATQAAYYIQALKLALCQPNVIGIITSTSATRRASPPGSPAPSTRTGRRSRRCPRCATHRRGARRTLTHCPDQTAPTVTISGRQRRRDRRCGGRRRRRRGELFVERQRRQRRLRRAVHVLVEQPKQGGAVLEVRAGDAAGNVAARDGHGRRISAARAGAEAGPGGTFTWKAPKTGVVVSARRAAADLHSPAAGGKRRASR